MIHGRKNHNISRVKIPSCIGLYGWRSLIPRQGNDRGARVPERYVIHTLCIEVAPLGGSEGRPGCAHESLLVEFRREVDYCAVVVFVGAVGLLEDLGTVDDRSLDHVFGEDVEGFVVGVAV